MLEILLHYFFLTSIWLHHGQRCAIIRSQVLHKELLNALCAYLFNFLSSRSAFTFYSIYVIMSRALQNRCVKYVIETFQKKNMKN